MLLPLLFILGISNSIESSKYSGDNQLYNAGTFYGTKPHCAFLHVLSHCTITVTEIVPSLRRQLRGSSHLQTSFSRDFLAAPDQSIDHVRVSTGPGESLLHFSGRPGRAGWLHGQYGREACGETHLGRGQRRMLSVSMDGATGSFDARSPLSSRHPACRSCCFPWAIVFPSVRPVRCFPLACGVGSSASVRPSRDAAVRQRTLSPSLP